MSASRIRDPKTYAIIGAAMEVHKELTLHKAHQAQTIHYLTATKLEIGLLLNFGKESLEYKRFIKSKN